jgi:hypothetical protein
MSTFIIFDNGGITPDRFTIIDRETGDVFGASENPNALNWIAKFIGNCADHRVVLRGAGWRQGLPSRRIIQTEIENYVNNAKLDPEWIGRELDFAALPENIRRFIAGLNVARPEGATAEASVVYMSTSQDDKAPAFGL